MTAYSESNCPLCGKPNHCAMAAGNDASECWCRDIEIDSAALERLPPEAVGRYCICRDCAQPTGDEAIER